MKVKLRFNEGTDLETKKKTIKDQGKTMLVRELVNADFTTEEAIDLVYDIVTLDHKDFVAKYMR